MTRRFQPSRERRGQLTVEFAASALGLLLLTVSMIYAAQLLYAYNFVCYAAREGTRWAAVNGSQSPSPATASQISQHVVNEALALNATQPGPLVVNVSWNPANNNPGSTVIVNVQYTFSLGIPTIMTKNVTVSSTSEMVISQ